MSTAENRTGSVEHTLWLLVDHQHGTCSPNTATAGTFINLEQLEDLARPLLPKQVFDYYAGAAEREQTLHDNRTSYTDMYRLIPRVLVDVSLVDTSTMLFGTRLAFPVLIAPMAFQQMAHPEGELAVARAARAAGTSMIVSTMATISLQDIANDPNTDNMWFQVYVLKERRYTQHMVEEAERMGYKAIVVTVDAPVLGKRERDITNRWLGHGGVWCAMRSAALIIMIYPLLQVCTPKAFTSSQPVHYARCSAHTPTAWWWW